MPFPLLISCTGLYYIMLYNLHLSTSVQLISFTTTEMGTLFYTLSWEVYIFILKFMIFYCNFHKYICPETMSSFSSGNRLSPIFYTQSLTPCLKMLSEGINKPVFLKKCLVTVQTYCSHSHHRIGYEE